MGQYNLTQKGLAQYASIIPADLRKTWNAVTLYSQGYKLHALGYI